MVYSKKGEIRFDDLCLEGDASSNKVIKFQKCSSANQKQFWDYNPEVNPIGLFSINDLYSFLDEIDETRSIRRMHDSRSAECCRKISHR